MCGIWGRIGYGSLNTTRIKLYENKFLNKLKNRGPESSSIKIISGSDTNAILGFTRLAINGLTKEGMQPVSCEENKIHWICNGEIYNWKEVAKNHGIECPSGVSDCYIIGPLWKKLRHNPTAFFRALDGVFAMIIIDQEMGTVTVGRDPYGVRPLFFGVGCPDQMCENVSFQQYYEYSTDHIYITQNDGLSDSASDDASDGSTDRSTASLSNPGKTVYFSSEMKGLIGLVYECSVFLPGYWTQYDAVTTDILQEHQYHTIPWLKNPALVDSNTAAGAVRISLEEAVRKRLMTERPVAALLSGGIDSSLIAALVQRELKALGKPPLETYSIGFAESTDLMYARAVAAWIGSNHHEIIMTPDEFFAAIPRVIADIESYDITSVRASVGNWLICREIARTSAAKVVFNGDGSDEVFGSYLYFFRAPTDEEFEAESERLLKDIHLYDVLRSDRSISSHGLEARTPFLDKQFVAVARSVPTIFRRPRRYTAAELRGFMERSNPPDFEERCEKWILRKAFESTGILPPEVLWRQKEAFSDGVSGKTKSWYQEIQERVATILTKPEEEWKAFADHFYKHLTPRTLEAYYYRRIFDAIYGRTGEEILRYFWMPKWSGETTDPSARTLTCYAAGDKK